MAGQPIAIMGSTTSGHAKCSPPTKIAKIKQEKVFTQKKILVATVGSITAVHGCKDDDPHTDKVMKGAAKVMIKKSPVARQGDQLSRGASITSGNKQVLVGG